MWSRLPSTITITVSSLPVDQSMNVEERPAEKPGGLYPSEQHTLRVEVRVQENGGSEVGTRRKRQAGKQSHRWCG